MKKILIIYLLLMTSLLSMAQSRITVTGTVKDSEGLPLPAVTVYEAGKTSNGVLSDNKGKYKITITSDGSLVFSMMGYADQKIGVAGRTVIDVVMEDENLFLDAAEVVEIGYGTVAKRDLTGSVAKVDMDKITKAPVVNFDQAIAGRIAGVVVKTSDGSLGENASITIRGNNSLTQSNEPLYIIDGFPSESSFATNMNPEDIASIDVLKDASATAIYGARGANGVIVITTKSGTEGKPEVNFTASYSVSKISNKIELLDAYGFVALQSEILAEKGSKNSYLGETYTLDDYRTAPTLDWQDAIYQIAPRQNYSLRVSGGSKASGTNYSASLSLMDMDGIISNSSFQRYQGKLNLTQKIGKRTSLNVMANYSEAVTNGVKPTDALSSNEASSYLMYSVWGYRPTLPLSRIDDLESLLDDLLDNEEGDLGDHRFNPIISVRNQYKKRVVDVLSASANLTVDITSDLKFKTNLGYTSSKTRNETFNNSKTSSGYPGSRSGKGINGSIGYTNKDEWLNENTLTYNKTIKKNHRLSLLGGITFQGLVQTYQGVAANNLTTEALGLNGLNTGIYQKVTPYQREWTLMSYLSRLNYSYKWKYYLTLSMRADGSSKFPEANRWGYFPSASAAWNFYKEKPLARLGWLSNGKLRLSWGQTGNNRTSTPYDFYAIMVTTPASSSSNDYVFDGNIIPGYYPSNMENPNLRWETTEQTNIGVDFGFFKNRITLTADVYLKNTRDLLFNATLPASSGYTKAMLNIGSMQNKGLEITTSITPVKARRFEWNIEANIGINRNKVTSLATFQNSLLSSVSFSSLFGGQYAYITQVGMPTGMMYGYIYEGTYKEEHFDGNGLKQEIACLESLDRSVVRPGDPKYADINGDRVIDDNDRTIIGCGQPIHTGGFGSDIRWGAFDFRFFFNWSYGQDVINANRYMFENGNRSSLNQFASMNDRYNRITNPNSDIPRAGAQGMNEFSSRVVEDASYLKLDNVTLGYTMPSKVSKALKVKSARLSVSAENILTFTNYSGPDPEVSTHNSVLTPGFDYSAYARAKGITGKLTLTF